MWGMKPHIRGLCSPRYGEKIKGRKQYYNSQLLGRRLTAILPNRGKQRAHDEKAAFPSWASTVPNLAQTDIRIKRALN